jgi:hypothetical protein
LTGGRPDIAARSLVLPLNQRPFWPRSVSA